MHHEGDIEDRTYKREELRLWMVGLRMYGAYCVASKGTVTTMQDASSYGSRRETSDNLEIADYLQDWHGHYLKDAHTKRCLDEEMSLFYGW